MGGYSTSLRHRSLAASFWSRAVAERVSYRIALVLPFVGVLAAAGGSSYYADPRQAVIRVAAIVVIAVSLWPLDLERLRHFRSIFAFAALVAALVLFQLLPLPPELWAALPGHVHYAAIAEASATVGWRPLSLTPDLTENAAQALLVPAAAGLAAIYLDRRDRKRLFDWLLAVACISALLGAVQLAAGEGAMRFYTRTNEVAPVGLFANQNHQAAMLACAMPLAAARCAGRLREGRAHRVVLPTFVLIVVLLLVMLIATGSRMGVVSGAVGLAGAGIAWRFSGESILPRTGKARLLAAGALAMLLVVVGTVIARSNIPARLAETDFATETRVASFKPLLETAKAFMPTGAGFGSFESVYRQFEPDALLSTIYLNQAHNEPLQLAIEGGLPAIALLCQFLWWWVSTVRRLVRSKPGMRRNASALAAVMVTLILMMSSLVDYPLRTPMLAAIFAIACVEMAHAAREPGEAAGTTRGGR